MLDEDNNEIKEIKSLTEICQYLYLLKYRLNKYKYENVGCISEVERDLIFVAEQLAEIIGYW